MKALVGAFNQEKALVGAFSVIVQPVVEPIDRFAALVINFSTLPVECRADLIVEDVHGLGVGVVPHPEGSLHVVGDVADEGDGVLDGLGVEVLLLVGGHLGSI